MRTAANKPEEAPETGIFHTEEAPAALRGKFVAGGWVRITVEAVDENGLTAAERAELLQDIRDVDQGRGVYGPFSSVAEMLADADKRIASGD
jgi:hypothetical protein